MAGRVAWTKECGVSCVGVVARLAHGRRGAAIPHEFPPIIPSSPADSLCGAISRRSRRRLPSSCCPDIALGSWEQWADQAVAPSGCTATDEAREEPADTGA